MLGLVGDIVCVSYLLLLVPCTIFFDSICEGVMDIHLKFLELQGKVVESNEG